MATPTGAPRRTFCAYSIPWSKVRPWPIPRRARKPCARRVQAPSPPRRAAAAKPRSPCTALRRCRRDRKSSNSCAGRAPIVRQPRMERQFNAEIESLKLGAGETFHGEGILAVTKALLQSGVSYVGGYQGAPVSHLLDVMVQARVYMNELGVHVEACTNEASAAAMLGASINYPARGAVTWKSIVGTNVASDALTHVASAGVIGGALIVVGEDYGEGASVAQERTHAVALKSSMWMLDPRPNLATIANLVERGFELSEASNTPVLMDLRIRACHVHGSFKAGANRAPALSTRKLLADPAVFDYEHIPHPPATYRQEKLKMGVRMPAARKYIRAHKLNELFAGSETGIGIICQGGLYNNL